jgi:SRSO17 transposase
MFATKPSLARRMLERAFAAEVPAAWVAGDAVYGDASDLRRWLEARGAAYVLAVSCSHMIWQAGQQHQAVDLIATVPAEAWVTHSCGAGSQGERLYDWTWIRLPYESAAGLAHWLLARRSLSDPTELAYYRAFGPTDTSLTELVRVAGMRWAIEENFEDAKGMVGLDHYEVRKWNAWYRHVTLALLAHAYLAATRRQARRVEREKGEVGATSSR